MAVFFIVFIAIMAALVIRDPWFGFLTPAGYLYAFAVLPWPWRLPGVAAVAVVAATSQTSGVDRASPFGIIVYAAVLSVNVIPLCALAWMDWSNDTHAAQREQALAEVREANQRLEATLAENAGLHEQLLTQAREAGVLHERQRMAGEIHDTLAQSLTGIIPQLHAAGGRKNAQLVKRRRRCAVAAASPRLVTPSLPRMLDTCTLAVFTEMNSSLAISRLLWPAARSRSTSYSRAVSPSAGSGPVGWAGLPAPAG
jgi:signal transduction histidine kinase